MILKLGAPGPSHFSLNETSHSARGHARLLELLKSALETLEPVDDHRCLLKPS